MNMILLDRPFSEQQLRNCGELELRNVTPKVWPTVLSECRQASVLRLYHITLPSVEGLESLVGVRHLTLEWATRITELSPVFQLDQLRSLSVFDLPKLKQLAGIEALTELTELKLSGSRGSISPPLRLNSIEPVTRIAGLTAFSLSNAQIEDDDVTTLARCSHLRHLQLSNQFERSQVAFLAKRLNGQLATPLTSHRDMNLSCEKCNAHKSMFIGRRMPILCHTCDKPRFERLTHEFEELVRNA